MKSFAVADDKETIYYGTMADELFIYIAGKSERIAQNVVLQGLMGHLCVVGSDIVIWTEKDTEDSSR